MLSAFVIPVLIQVQIDESAEFGQSARQVAKRLCNFLLCLLLRPCWRLSNLLEKASTQINLRWMVYAIKAQ